MAGHSGTPLAGSWASTAVRTCCWTAHRTGSRSATRGAATDLTESVVREFALANGRVDVKVRGRRHVVRARACDQEGGQVIIESRFNGPPGSGNGGYTCGLVASHVDAPGATVMLRTPPPLDTPMTVRHVEGGAGGVRVFDPDGLLVAEATPARVVDTAPPDAGAPDPLTWAEAVTASAGYRGFTAHPFPGCFVCGPDREAGDGLRIFPGPAGDGRTAAPWRVPADVSAPLVWAALDCPGGWAVPMEVRPYVLGRMTAEVDALPAPGDACVVMGRFVAEDGRKAHVLTTLHGPDGRMLAQATATWIALRTG
jgi:hypothetical protein